MSFLEGYDRSLQVLSKRVMAEIDAGDESDREE
jgi:hypothetical protein